MPGQIIASALAREKTSKAEDSFGVIEVYRVSQGKKRYVGGCVGFGLYGNVWSLGFRVSSDGLGVR